MDLLNNRAAAFFKLGHAKSAHDDALKAAGLPEVGPLWIACSTSTSHSKQEFMFNDMYACVFGQSRFASCHHLTPAYSLSTSSRISFCHMWLREPTTTHTHTALPCGSHTGVSSLSSCLCRRITKEKEAALASEWPNRLSTKVRTHLPTPMRFACVGGCISRLVCTPLH